MKGPTFMLPEEIIEKHKAGTLNERQSIVALARYVLELENRIQELLHEVRND